MLVSSKSTSRNAGMVLQILLPYLTRAVVFDELECIYNKSLSAWKGNTKCVQIKPTPCKLYMIWASA